MMGLHYLRVRPSVACLHGFPLILTLGMLTATAQAPKSHLRPTELVVKRYERLILHGALLTPDGWKLTSRLFTKPEPYPESSEIQVEWTGTMTLGEDWNNGSRAQVSTKWNDFYGRIDSNLLFHQDRLAVLPVAESFTLIFVPCDAEADKGNLLGTRQGEWKIEGSLRARSADIPSAIKYLEKMREQTSDPALRKNADSSIHALKHLRLGCQVPNPC